MNNLNQKQLNISLLLLFLACTSNSFGMGTATRIVARAAQAAGPVAKINSHKTLTTKASTRKATFENLSDYMQLACHGWVELYLVTRDQAAAEKIETVLSTTRNMCDDAILAAKAERTLITSVRKENAMNLQAFKIELTQRLEETKKQAAEIELKLAQQKIEHDNQRNIVKTFNDLR